ncbi:MAG: Trypsin protein [uncultured bacterium]|nr:MAG: Trypsin protein [uncultured bacterium]
MDIQNENNMEKKSESKKITINISRWTLLGIVILVVLISSIFGAFFGFVSGGTAGIFSSKIGTKLEKIFPTLKSDDVVSEVKQQMLIEDSAVIDVVEKNSPSVVSIVVSKDVARVGDLFNSPGWMFDPFFGGQIGGEQGLESDEEPQKEKVGGGTGFLISKDGMILTNKHVVQDKNAEYTVVTSDGKEFKATVLALDPVRDIAVIKIDGNDFPTLSLGNSGNIKIGQTVIAIGNSLGEFSNSVSRGIISGLKRNIDAGSGFGDSERLTNIIQTDAAINPGNSGGPLLNLNGEVVGINVATAQGAENVGFAIPIDQSDRIIEEAKSGKKVVIPFLGIRYIIINQAIQQEAQLPFSYGALIARGEKITDFAVLPGSSADKAGLIENDIILEIDGKKITKEDQLSDMISNKSVGDEVTLKVWHKGDTKDVRVILQERK